MIQHLVLFRLRAGVTPDDPRLRAVARAMDELPSQIPVIQGWQHGRNLTPDAEAWDYGLCAMFDNQEDLHAYFEHPAHQPVLAAWNEIATLAFVDIGEDTPPDLLAEIRRLREASRSSSTRKTRSRSSSIT